MSARAWGGTEEAKGGALAAGTLPLAHPAPPKPSHGAIRAWILEGRVHSHLPRAARAEQTPSLRSSSSSQRLVWLLGPQHPPGTASPAFGGWPKSTPRAPPRSQIQLWGAEMSQLGSCSPTNSVPPALCAQWPCPGTDADCPARSPGKVLMTLITGLVCAINIYFVVDFLPTLHGLEYYMPLGLLLAAYVAFVAYLVGLAPWDRGGTASLVGAHRFVLCPADLDMQHRARSPVPGPGPPQPLQFRSRPRPDRDTVTDPIPVYYPHGPAQRGLLAPDTDLLPLRARAISGTVLARDAPGKERVKRRAALPPRSSSPALLPSPNPRQFRGAGPGWMRGQRDNSGGAPIPWHRHFTE